MKNLIPVVGVAVALLAFPAVAQNDVPGEARAKPSTPHTKEERRAARSKRQATGKEVTRQGNRNLDVEPPAKPGSVTPATAEERAAARKQRKQQGTEAARNPPAVGPAGTSP